VLEDRLTPEVTARFLDKGPAQMHVEWPRRHPGYSEGTAGHTTPGTDERSNQN